MDVVLEIFDTFLFDYAYATFLPLGQGAAAAGSKTSGVNSANLWQYRPASKALALRPSASAWLSQWPRDNVYRQALSLFTIAWVFGLLTYFLFASLSYLFLFNKEDAFNHPKYLKNQIALEIKTAASAIPVMGALTVPVFLAEVRGYTKLYDAWSDAPFPLYNFIQYPFFIAFTDCCIYFIHRGLHYPPVYKLLHKPHHKWIVPTPFASHAFHPLDGLAQSLPYHIFPFLFPLQKLAYVALFVAVNFWTIFIHDGDYVANNPVINGAACHTMHHLYFNYNYGQYTTLWDRLGGSYRYPTVPEKEYGVEGPMGAAPQSNGRPGLKNKTT